MDKKNIKEKQIEEYKVRTDLAIEAREMVHQDEEIEIKGVELEEKIDESIDLKITKVSIKNEHGAKQMNKPIGNYITIECELMKENDSEVQEKLMKELANEIKDVIDIANTNLILVVGLGNEWVTPDSLGPKVVSNLLVTRHLYEEMQDAEYLKSMGKVSAISPGVMGQTGMETYEIVKGIVDEVKPDLIIAIDALASRKTSRVNSTIQIADTGVHPGSGVGNKRKGLTEESLGIPVLAIGVPTVVDAATIVNDTMDNLIQAMMSHTSNANILNSLQEFSNEEKYQLIKEVLNPYMSNMFVTPKDIDSVIKRIGFVISGALNMTLHPEIDRKEITEYLN
ncbi:spore protease [Natranaerovirga hydrolytica]|uniref:Germination protease n=1 Tax=Natranaerovirga hydrolytica TaxID=680378 RepID=A0A4R1MX97_9FIRM|nr:GPR endopeptidase [Natranaerovirga hydrolytica]TCK97877.1 spore protease [Natranaerovirga hydrolytica]